MSSSKRSDRLRRTRANNGIAPTQNHGAATYANWGCRCETCRTAWCARVRTQRRTRHDRTRVNNGIAPTKNHGAATYTNWGCRCETCRADRAAQRKIYEPTLTELRRRK